MYSFLDASLFYRFESEIYDVLILNCFTVIINVAALLCFCVDVDERKV
jgi:hypothetical protein